MGKIIMCKHLLFYGPDILWCIDIFASLNVFWFLILKTKNLDTKIFFLNQNKEKSKMKYKSKLSLFDLQRGFGGCLSCFSGISGWFLKIWMYFLLHSTLLWKPSSVGLPSVTYPLDQHLPMSDLNPQTKNWTLKRNDKLILQPCLCTLLLNLNTMN